MEVKLYTKRNCKFCSQAKEYFKEKGIAITEIDLSIGGNPETIQMKKKFKEMGIDTIPIVVVEDDSGGQMIFPEFDEEKMNQVFEFYEPRYI